MGTINQRSGEYRLAREKARKRIITIITAVIIIALVIYIVWFVWDGIRNKEYHGYTVESSFERVDSNSVTYMSYDGNLLKYSRDGAAALDSEGNALWNGSFEMNNPIIDRCGTYVAIADAGGKEIYVYSGSDSGTKIDVPLPIQTIRVASQGVVAAVLEDSSSNTINLYDPYSNTDKLLVEVPTNVTTDGCPVDIALSPDGNSLVTSYLSITGGAAESNVCFYNFSEVGQDKNRIVGGKTYSESLAVKLEYIDDDTVCVLLDNGFTLFNNMKQPVPVASEEFDREIKSVVKDDGNIGFIFTQNDDEGQYNMKIYNESGNTVLDTNIDYQYDRVYMEDDEVTFLSDMGCTIMKLNGVCKFQKDFDKSVHYMFKVDKDSYYMIDDDMINLVKLTEDET